MIQIEKKLEININMEPINQTYDIMIYYKTLNFALEEINKKNGNSFVPDPDYIKDIIFIRRYIWNLIN